MRCKKCTKQTNGKNKVYMKTDLENQVYLCPECGFSVDWNRERDGHIFSNNV